MPTNVVAVAKTFKVPHGAAVLDVRRLPNPFRAIRAKELSEDLDEIEAWLRRDARACKQLDCLVEKGRRCAQDTLYVVCHGGKHRSQVVARLIRGH